MGEKAKEAVRVQFDKRLRLEFQRARITSDAMGTSLVFRLKRDEGHLTTS